MPAQQDMTDNFSPPISERAAAIHRAATAFAEQNPSDPWAYGVISLRMHEGLVEPDQVLSSLGLIQ
jgi:hypothetical protein